MSELTFELDADETSVLELKFGQYIKGDKGDTGPRGETGADGSLKPADVAYIDAATKSAQGSAQAAAGSAQAAANSATSAAASATQAKNDGQAAAAQAQASATAAKTSETNAAGSAGQASASRDAAAASASASAASSTAAGTWQALAQDWAVKMGGLVSGTDYSSKYYAGQSSASATASAGSATASAGSAAASAASATQSANSATAAAGSASAAAGSAQDAADNAASVNPQNLVPIDGSRPMTGRLSINQPAGIPPGLMLKTGTYQPFVRANSTNSSWEWVNSANTAVNMALSDGGYLTVRAGANLGARPTWAGLTPWDNGNRSNPPNCSTSNGLTFDWGANYAGQIGVKVDTTLMGFMIHSGNIGGQVCYSSTRLRISGSDVPWTWSGQAGQPSWVWGGNDLSGMYVYNPANFNVSYANAAGSVGGVSNPASLSGAQFTGQVNVIANGDPNGFQGTLGPGYLKLNEYNYGAYIDLARARSEDYKWRIHYNFNNAYLEFNFNGGGLVQFATDGNIFCKGQWFSNLSVRGTQIPWATGIGTETAAGNPGGGQTCDFGSPWLGAGLRFGASGATWVWLRGTWLING